MLHVPLRFALVTRYAAGSDLRLCAPHALPAAGECGGPNASPTHTHETFTAPNQTLNRQLVELQKQNQKQKQKSSQQMFAFEVVSLSGQSTGALCSHERAVSVAWTSAIARNARLLTHSYVCWRYILYCTLYALQ